MRSAITAALMLPLLASPVFVSTAFAVEVGDHPYYLHCVAAGYNDVQCDCLGQYIAANDWNMNEDLLLFLEINYTLAGAGQIDDGVYEVVRSSGYYWSTDEEIHAAAKLVTDATNYCKDW